MLIVDIVVAIALVGVVVYLVTTFLPMPAPFKQAIYIVCSVGLLLYLLSALGLWHGFNGLRLR